jgi:GTP-binding protein Era
VVARSTRWTRSTDKRALLPRLAALGAMRDVGGDRAGLRPSKGTQLSRAQDRDRAPPARIPAALYGRRRADRSRRALSWRPELVREKIFRQLGDEVPYATTVDDRQFEQEGACAAFNADGARRQGEPARDPARRRRLAHEGRSPPRRAPTWSACSDGPVFLEVWVRVKKGWADDDASLARLGY